MATRMYMAGKYTGLPQVTPDASWEQTAQVVYGELVNPQAGAYQSLSNTITIPITTTQDILAMQLISPPLTEQTITGTVSLVVNQANESVSTANATLDLVIRLVSRDGTTVRGNMVTVTATDTEFPSAAAQTRIVNAATLTSQTSQMGDRIVVELGVNAAAPSTSGSAGFLLTASGQADTPLTSGLNTIQDTWIEFSQNLIFLPTNKIGKIIRPRAFSPGLAR